MFVVQTTFLGSAFNTSATFQCNGCCIKGSVNYKTRCSSEHEGIGGEDLSFFDRNGCIGMNMQICANVTAAQGDYIVSVALNKEASEVKVERVMRNDEQTHDLSGFKLLEDNMTVFSPSVGKTIPLTGIFRDDGHKLVILPDTQLTGLADVGEATKVGTIFRHLL